VFNLYLWSSGRRVTTRYVRQALLPGAFFGLNLAIRFAGATKNSVANAALIGWMAPFFIVPIGAKLFRSSTTSQRWSLLWSPSAAWASCSSALHQEAMRRSRATSSALWRCCCWWPTSTRHFRRDMDVAIFMATICPIGALAVLRIAATNGDGFGVSGRGWLYMLILTFLSGVAANGLMVFAQKTIQIGTIAVAQVVNPAIAVVWSFLLLNETLRVGQAVGIAIATGGLTAFLVLNQRGKRARQARIVAKRQQQPRELSARPWHDVRRSL
jgi:drug/metabolite transporter (DMT)-like permease